VPPQRRSVALGSEHVLFRLINVASTDKLLTSR